MGSTTFSSSQFAPSTSIKLFSQISDPYGTRRKRPSAFSDDSDNESGGVPLDDSVSKWSATVRQAIEDHPGSVTGLVPISIVQREMEQKRLQWSLTLASSWLETSSLFTLPKEASDPGSRKKG